jgi:hypothetical protein
VAVNTADMREFATQCLRWSEETRDRGQRDLIVRIGQSWINTASILDQRIDEGFRLVGDLRRKLD